MIIFRKYQKADFSSVKEILQEAKMFAEPWESEENLEGMISKDDQSILVAEDEKNKKVVGSVFMIPYGTKVILLFRLAIKSEYQRKGIGSKLIQHAAEISKQWGVKELGLFVDVKNKKLHDYYAKLGFILFPESVTYMYKDLK